MNGKVLEFLRELVQFEPGKLNLNDPSYCAGFTDGQIKLAKQLLNMADPQPKEENNFRRRHYILWSDEKFPTISQSCGIFVGMKPLSDGIIFSLNDCFKTETVTASAFGL